jgi:NADPH-dependent ferric siderophore reductase
VSRPPSSAFRTQVTGLTALGTHFLRVTVTHPDLEHFGTVGLDTRIKLLLPRADGVVPGLGLFDDPPATIGEWYGRWRALPDDERNPLRTYTVRNVRPQSREIDIDFVLHGTSGPASAWA